MRKFLFGNLGALALALVFAGTSQAQVFTPTYTSPRLINEFSFAAADRPGDLALEGLWRGGPLGVRVGYTGGDAGLLSVGGELRNQIPMDGAPVGLAFTAGAQGLFGDDNAVGLQTGISAGHTFMGTGVAVTPYIHPRIGLINDLGADNFEVRALADAGVDVEFHNNLIVRFGANLGDTGNVGSNWGVGIGWRR
jgi:hypothetical protein